MSADMPTANTVWGDYLKSHGFRRYLIDDGGKDGYTVYDFCSDNPHGSYVLALNSHVVAVCDGKYFDTFDSGMEIPIYYWCREDKR